MVQTVSSGECQWSSFPSWQCQRAHRSCNAGLSNRHWCSAGYPPTIVDLTKTPVTGFCYLPSRGGWKESRFRAPKIPELTSRVSLDIPQLAWSRVKDSWFKRMGKCARVDRRFLSHWYDSTPEKSRRERDSSPGSSALKADALTTRPTRRSARTSSVVCCLIGLCP